MKFYDHAKYKFICGSNLLWKNMMKPRPVFNVDLTNCRPYRNSILMGVGLGQAHSKTNWYTKKLYSKILNKNVVHSVRDQHTADFLKSLGYKAIDTGCPTMWQFTSDFCRSIPEKKADNVIFTLTDYGRDKTNDQKLIDILLQHYKTVYFWIQGAFDKEYFDSFKNTETITAHLFRRVQGESYEIYYGIIYPPKLLYPFRHNTCIRGKCHLDDTYFFC